MDRWLFEYEGESTRRFDGDRMSVHRILAAAAPGEFYHFSAHGSENLPWRSDPTRQELFLSDGRAFHNWPFNRIHARLPVNRGDPLPGSSASDILFAVMPAWPLADYLPPTDSESGLSFVVENILTLPEYEVSTVRELVNGEPCCVVERRGVDKVWLAVDKNLCVMRREIRDAASSRLRQLLWVERFRQTANGLWFPDVIVNQLYPRGGFDDEHPEHEFKIRLIRCEVGSDVSDDVFRPAFPPGSLVVDGDKAPTQISPGGEDLLSDVSEWLTDAADMPRSQPTSWREISFLAGGVLMGILFVTGFYSRMERNAPNSTDGRAPDPPLGVVSSFPPVIDAKDGISHVAPR